MQHSPLGPDSSWKRILGVKYELILLTKLSW